MPLSVHKAFADVLPHNVLARNRPEVPLLKATPEDMMRTLTPEITYLLNAIGIAPERNRLPPEVLADAVEAVKRAPMELQADFVRAPGESPVRAWHRQSRTGLVDRTVYLRAAQENNTMHYQ